MGVGPSPCQLTQIFRANSLLLKGLFLAVIVTIHGGAAFLKHPAVPFDEELASIWRLSLIRLLLRYPHAPFKKITIEHWRYGAAGIRPTMLLCSNAKLPEALDACRLPFLVRFYLN